MNHLGLRDTVILIRHYGQKIEELACDVDELSDYETKELDYQLEHIQNLIKQFKVMSHTIEQAAAPKDFVSGG